MSRKPWEWTEGDLIRLFGELESIRLEFKSSSMLTKWNSNKIRDVLSKEVSAFANSEGGSIIIGISERKKGKMKIADGFEGIDPKEFNPERLQQIIESNISPSLPGIRINTVKLSEDPGKVAYVIYVPQGATAYQASDKRYYSRSEYEIKAMPDHEIRLRMMKGRIPQVKIKLSQIKLLTATEEYNERQSQLKKLKESNDIGENIRAGRLKEKYNKPKRDFDKLIISLQIINTGEITLRDFLLTVATNMDSKLEKSKFRFSKGKQVKSHKSRIEPVEKLFPHQKMIFPNKGLSIECSVDSYLRYKKNRDKNEMIIYWTVFLDDGPPCSGEIFLFSEYESTFKKRQTTALTPPIAISVSFRWQN